jgi:hypothetical protein
VNDLNRHKKSVHNIIDGAATKSYQCASEVCRKKDKIWPRLDNFKQHIKRMHTDENVDDLVRRWVLSDLFSIWRLTLADPSAVVKDNARTLQPLSLLSQ